MTAISVRNLSKKYRLFDNNGDRVKEALTGRCHHRDFWALRDINLDIPKGITLGIVGRNGSGKSTLLQIIAGIRTPTEGSITTRGRVCSLSLGTGFNPDLSGRENLLQYAQVMGFSRREALERIPDVEAFAEIGDFIWQPLKAYSSGMYFRLAFAAAVQVDPDILLIDEAMAVGDARFQRKCYRKFEEYQDAGKTIILVAHDRGAIVTHCSRAILLDGGRVICDGSPNEVGNLYYEMLFDGMQQTGAVRSLGESQAELPDPLVAAPSAPALASDPTLDEIITIDDVAETPVPEIPPAAAMAVHLHSAVPVMAAVKPRPPTKADAATLIAEFCARSDGDDRCLSRRSFNPAEHRFGDGEARIVDYLIVHGDAADCSEVPLGSRIDVYVRARFEQDTKHPSFGLILKSQDGIMLYGSNSDMLGVPIEPAKRGESRSARFSLDIPLRQGAYFLGIGVARTEYGQTLVCDSRRDVAMIEVARHPHFDGLVDLKLSCDPL